MYTSMKVIYGVPFTKGHADVIRSWPKDDPRHKGNEPMDDLEVYGFEQLPGRDHNDNPIGYVGVEMASSAVIPGCPVPFNELDVGPSFNQRDEACGKYDRLDPELRRAGDNPRLYLIPWES